jgi:hypothetical protein
MPVGLKRRYNSGSSSDIPSCGPVRQTRPLPHRRGRFRKAQRICSAHVVATIPAALQQHRSRDASFTCSDTEVSSDETDLGTALSEVESELPGKSHDADAMDMSSPCKEENEVEDDLDDVRMSSPSPFPTEWSSAIEKSSLAKLDLVTRIDKDLDVDDRPQSEVKRRRIVFEAPDSDAEADDEMEETESVMATPKQKRTVRIRKVSHICRDAHGDLVVPRIALT